MTSIKFLFSFKVKMIQGQIIVNNTARLALMFWHINTFIMKGSAKWRKEENAFQDIRPLEINQSFQLHLHSQQLWRWWGINTPPDTSSSDNPRPCSGLEEIWKYLLNFQGWTLSNQWRTESWGGDICECGEPRWQSDYRATD